MPERYPLDQVLGTMRVCDLSLPRRRQLSTYLNVMQVIVPESTGLYRDYRGIGQQLQFSHQEMEQLKEHYDPFGRMLSFHSASALSLLELCRIIERIGRYDVLDDMVETLREDVYTFQQQQQQQADEQKRQKMEVATTVSDPVHQWYDAYVCYADSDLDWVMDNIVDYLESPEHNLRLFVRARDMLGGQWIYETFSELIETQCRKVLIVLSPEFLRCADCTFQSQFAAGLALERRQRMLVPIIKEACPLPPLIRMLTKIDMTRTRGNIPRWTLERLVLSVSTNARHVPRLPPTHQVPLITLPPTTSTFPSTNSPAAVQLMTFDEHPGQNEQADEDLPPHIPSIPSLPSPMSTTSSVIDDQAQLISNTGRQSSTVSTAAAAAAAVATTTSSSPTRRFLQNIKRKIKVPF